MVLACLLGIYTVLERSGQTKARYRIAILLEQEKKLDEEIMRAELQLSALMSPGNLDRLNKDLALNLSPLDKSQGLLKNQCARR